uniref:Cytochrome c oxidase subunit 3 n=1 Tax=Moniezia benedeni TaxID=218196 RepID=A0A2D0VPX6_9CEST|nr:cytochrome c oxidase subunit III [Moniezia benedeni]AOY40422.1 cytochrome c oxidase subunit III [Moniezia benedeni]
MSIIPIFVAFSVGLLISGLFLWKVWFVGVSLFILVCLLWVFSNDMVDIFFHYEVGFWLFIVSEVMIFGCLFFNCLFFDCCNYMSLSSPLELPFLGCFVLLGSSITITAFHHLLGWSKCWVLLILTIVLGLSFVILQFVEMNEILMSILNTSFHASSFCTIGLHFSHVVMGVVAFFFILFIGVCNAGVYRCSVVTWYSHFVDYVWLFVYMFVYVC